MSNELNKSDTHLFILIINFAMILILVVLQARAWKPLPWFNWNLAKTLLRLLGLYTVLDQSLV